MRKRIKQICTFCFLFLCGMLYFGVNGNAYIDPSVMTYMIQVVAGIVVAVGAVAGIYVRKLKKKLSERLGVDENRNKEVESDDIVVDEYVKL